MDARFTDHAMRCPTCETPLQPRTVGAQAFEGCPQCGGEYFDHRALEELLRAHEASSAAGAAEYRRPSPLSDPVRYRKCPVCDEQMTRRNFRETSGVVVDSCPSHGFWLDRGELAALIEFAATGALTAAEQRIAAVAKAKKRPETFGADRRTVGFHHYIVQSPADTVDRDARDAPSDWTLTATAEVGTPHVGSSRASVPQLAPPSRRDEHPYRGGLPANPTKRRAQPQANGWKRTGVVLWRGARWLWRAVFVARNSRRARSARADDR